MKLDYSVCMITRDELDFLKGALENCLPHLSYTTEFVLIDGSADGSAFPLFKEWIGKTACQLVYVPLPQAWEKRKWTDEAKYRNTAWSFCRSSWILSIDDDEAYDKELYNYLLNRSDMLKYAYYFPTVNFFGSTKKVIDPIKFPDYHIRFANKNFFRWVGAIHSSLWLSGIESISPDHKIASTVPFPLYHYARVKGDVSREYGEIPKDLIDYDGKHPRTEFD